MKPNVLILLVIAVLLTFSSVWADSLNMELVGRDPFGSALDVFVAGDHAYLCAGGSLIILDISDPSNPIKVSRIDTPWIANAVSVLEKSECFGA